MSSLSQEIFPLSELKKEDKPKKPPSKTGNKSVLRKKLKGLSYEEGKKIVQLQESEKKEGKAKNLWDKGVEAGAKGIEKIDVKEEISKYLQKELEKILPKDMDKRGEVAFHLSDLIVNKIVEEEYPEFFDAIHNVKGSFANWLREHLAFNLDVKPIEPRKRPPKKKSDEEIFREQLSAALLAARKTPAEIEEEKKKKEEERAKDDADFIIAYNKCIAAETLEGKKTAYEWYLSKHPKGLHSAVAKRNIDQFNEMIHQELLEQGILKKDFGVIFKPTFDWDKKFVDKLGVKGKISYEKVNWRAMLKGEAVLSAPFTSDASLDVKAEGELGLGSKKRGVDLLMGASTHTESLYKSPKTSAEFTGKIIGKYDQFQVDVYSKYKTDFYGRGETFYGAGLEWKKDKSAVRLHWDHKGKEDFFGLTVRFEF